MHIVHSKLECCHEQPLTCFAIPVGWLLQLRCEQASAGCRRFPIHSQASFQNSKLVEKLCQIQLQFHARESNVHSCLVKQFPYLVWLLLEFQLLGHRPNDQLSSLLASHVPEDLQGKWKHLLHCPEGYGELLPGGYCQLHHLKLSVLIH